MRQTKDKPFRWVSPGLAIPIAPSPADLPFPEYHYHYEHHPHIEVQREPYRQPWDLNVTTFDHYRTLMDHPPHPHQNITTTGANSKRKKWVVEHTVAKGQPRWGRPTPSSSVPATWRPIEGYWEVTPIPSAFCIAEHYYRKAKNQREEKGRKEREARAKEEACGYPGRPALLKKLRQGTLMEEMGIRKELDGRVFPHVDYAHYLHRELNPSWIKEFSEYMSWPFHPKDDDDDHGEGGHSSSFSSNPVRRTTSRNSSTSNGNRSKKLYTTKRKSANESQHVPGA